MVKKPATEQAVGSEPELVGVEPQGRIRIALAGHFACLIFRPPLSPAEVDSFNSVQNGHISEPIWQGRIKLKGEPSDAVVWHKKNFGWNSKDRLEALQSFAHEEVAPRLPNRKLRDKPFELGDKAINFFKKREKEHAGSLPKWDTSF
ncbi:MAG TPA: hypothetical protein VLG27_00155 [Candidatus Saccharimonadia bacterium]|nr:hypothetical protein [Candidatus Saccharimonadia bacterium]